MKMKIFILSMGIITLLVDLRYVSTINLNKISEETQMRVEFYKINKVDSDKKEFLGYAEIREDKLFVDVKDERLEKILTSPYKTIRGDKRGSMIIDRVVVFQPGTKAHLLAIATECWQFGYIAKIIKNE